MTDGRDYRVPLQSIQVHTLDGIKTSISVTKPVSQPVDGQRIRQGNVTAVQEHATLTPVHVGPFDLGTRTLPVRPEDFPANEKLDRYVINILLRAEVYWEQ